MMRRMQGLGISDGIAIGKAVCIRTQERDLLQIPIRDSDIESEIERFEDAVRAAGDEVHRLRLKVGRELGDDLAAIFDAQALFLSDRSLIDRVVGHIRREGVNAEWALHETARELQARFAEIDAVHLRERSEDVRDVYRYLMRSLQGTQVHQLSEIEGDLVVVADDLTPSEAVRLGRENVVGFVLEHGSRTSHTSIIAQSLDLPAVAGVHGVLKPLEDRPEVPIVIDGSSGEVVLDPTPAVRRSFDAKRRDARRREAELFEVRRGRARTRDGVDITLMANIDLPEEIDAAIRFGAQGIGLYRSEFLYIERSPELPSEEEHLGIYRRMIEASAPHPAVIRTYDLGGRKIAKEVLETAEDNPVLGLRGIRLVLAKPEVFKVQLRALFRASIEGELWIMLPMVAVVEEIRRFRVFAAEVMDELEREGTPFGRDHRLGAMIEVPSAALIADVLAREVDFFSIGSNDLIQYAMAVDRNNDHVSDLYQPLHPGMIHLMRSVVASAEKEGIDVSLCGEMASDPRYTAVLLACGLRRLSMSPRRLPAIKQAIAQIDLGALDGLAAVCEGLATTDEVEREIERLVPSEPLSALERRDQP